MDELRELYQSVILDHNKKPRNFCEPSGANCASEGHNPLCGDHVTVFCELKDGVIRDVTFEGGGCAISTASASLMTESLRGKTLEEAKTIFRRFHSMVTDAEETADGPDLGKLEVFSNVCRYPTRVKWATLCWHTFNAALEDGSAPVSTE